MAGIVRLRRFARTRQIAAFVFLGAWSLAIVLIAGPGLSQCMAQAVGIGRGVDFATYSLLVRELAIAQATRPPARWRRGPRDVGEIPNVEVVLSVGVSSK